MDPDDPDAVRERRFSERMACPNDHPIAIDEIEPRSFSFNAPYGACPRVHRHRHRARGRPRAARPRRRPVARRRCHRPLGAGFRLGRLLPARHRRARRGPQLLDGHAVEGPAASGPRRRCCYGENYKVHVKYRNRYGRDRSYTTGFEGVVPFVKRRHAETDSDWSRERYEGYMREVPCPECKGARLKPESLAVLIGGKNISADLRAGHRRGRRVPRRRRLHGARAADRRAGHQGDRGAAGLPARRRPRLPRRSTGRPARCPAARRSASGWRRRSGPAWSACSTSSTSPRSACTSATTTGSSRR